MGHAPHLEVEAIQTGRRGRDMFSRPLPTRHRDIANVLQYDVYAKSEAHAKRIWASTGGSLLALQEAKEKAQDSYESPGTPIASRRPLGETPITGLDSFSTELGACQPGHGVDVARHGDR